MILALCYDPSTPLPSQNSTMVPALHHIAGLCEQVTVSPKKTLKKSYGGNPHSAPSQAPESEPAVGTEAEGLSSGNPRGWKEIQLTVNGCLQGCWQVDT